ncbi:hypothetical protein BJ875DRAFT_442313 [Amylocarpus encephaloides]|uniref:DUF7924 domain-containing protein n=1 Tax=Amylocarpus encephaloides TaxID=45428 RepID=A0A9P7YHM2_9HELO|nr:hypothetical protein BJ875DRAFT_442313 [Amylocarpus encephaloides]
MTYVMKPTKHKRLRDQLGLYPDPLKFELDKIRCNPIKERLATFLCRFESTRSDLDVSLSSDIVQAIFSTGVTADSGAQPTTCLLYIHLVHPRPRSKAMNTKVLCPKPQRPHKRALADIDPDAFPVSKHGQRSESPHPPRRPSSQRLDDLDLQVTRSGSAPPWPTCAPGDQHCRPQLPTDSPVEAWISAVFTPDPRPISHPGGRPSTCSSSGTSQSGSRPGTSHPLYRGTLYNNYITLDYSGRQMPEELRTFASTQILKQRESPQLGDEAVSRVIDMAEELADSTEGPTAKLIRTDMFPFERPGIVEGGNSPWSTVALPNNPEYQYDVSAPEPDTYFGYPTNQRSGWSYAQSNVITHPMARPYAQPARGNTFPFLMVERQSETAGGTIYVAENQAAGSEAGTHTSSSLTDTIAFTIAMSHREAIFYLHWYSEADHRFYMSYLKSYSSMETRDIRACNNTVKNIIDHGLGARRTAIGTALEALFPFPQQWKQARLPSTTSSTPATSFTEEAAEQEKEGRRRSKTYLPYGQVPPPRQDLRRGTFVSLPSAIMRTGLSGQTKDTHSVYVTVHLPPGLLSSCLFVHEPQDFLVCPERAGRLDAGKPPPTLPLMLIQHLFEEGLEGTARDGLRHPGYRPIELSLDYIEEAPIAVVLVIILGFVGVIVLVKICLVIAVNIGIDDYRHGVNIVLTSELL